MKNFFLTAMFAVFALGAATLASCDDGGDDGKTEVTSSTVSAKWNVGGTSDYESFEFNKNGNYIVVKKAAAGGSRAETAGDFLFGTYTISGSTINMSGFGKLVVDDLTSTAATFTLTLTGSTTAVEVSTSKATEMATSSKTDMLCRTWDFVKAEPNRPEDGLDGLQNVLFSKAGTYFVSFADSGDSQLNNWKWKSESAGTIYYSEDFPPVWGEDAVATIETLTATSLVVYEKWDDGGTVEEQRTWWKPAK